MLSSVRRLVHAYFAGQAELMRELRASRAELTAMRTELAQLRATFDAAPPEATGQYSPPVLALQQYLGAINAADGRHADPLSLERHRAQVYSQNGEDGMIAEIFRRIGEGGRTFVEIGVENGKQNNTRLLLEQGWRGVWIEGHPDHAAQAAARMKDAVASGALRIVCAMATPEGIDGLLEAAGLPEVIDFLSVDIDQNTTHVWRGLQRRARAVCVEYNASLPAAVALEVPYVPGGAWDGTNWFGGSLKAIERIGAAKGLHLVGCDPTGVNAFLVDAGETAGKFRAPFTAENHVTPALFGFVSHLGHRPSDVERRWRHAD